MSLISPSQDISHHQGVLILFPPSMASVRTLFGRPCLMRLVARCSPLNVPPYSWIAAPTTMANGIGKFFDVNPQAAADISHD